MATQFNKNLERKVVINNKEFIVYKENNKTFIKLNNEIVFPERGSKLSASQWLKKQK